LLTEIETNGALSQYDKYLAGVNNWASSVPFEAAGFFNFSIFFELMKMIWKHAQQYFKVENDMGR
jgi:hypothetical protein